MNDDEISLKLIIEFPTEEGMREFLQIHESARKSALVLGELRAELRSRIKYGKPTESDNYWYDRYWELCKEHNIDGWEV